MNGDYVGILVGAVLYSIFVGFIQRISNKNPKCIGAIRVDNKINLLLDHFDIPYNKKNDEVSNLVAQGLKINAIKLYREQTGVSLRDAQDFVEGLDARPSIDQKLDLILGYLAIPNDSPNDAVVELLMRGKKIEAIKLHRELTGLGLRESKDEVEAVLSKIGLGKHS
jgi:ribosomal protein L7/L12